MPREQYASYAHPTVAYIYQRYKGVEWGRPQSTYNDGGATNPLVIDYGSQGAVAVLVQHMFMFIGAVGPWRVTLNGMTIVDSVGTAISSVSMPVFLVFDTPQLTVNLPAASFEYTIITQAIWDRSDA